MARIPLREAISGLLADEWAATEPSLLCFDHDVGRMDLLLRYLGGGLSGDPVDDVRGHLLDCARCRYVISLVRESLRRPLTLTVYRWSNDMVMVFDGSGDQVPRLQGRYQDVRADVLNAAGPDSLFLWGDWASGVERVERGRW